VPEISELQAEITRLHAEVVNRDRVIDNLSGRLLAAARQAETLRDQLQSLSGLLRAAPDSHNGSYAVAVARLVEAARQAAALIEADGRYKLSEKRVYEELTAALAGVSEVGSKE
jgi:hypothetical protein